MPFLTGKSVLAGSIVVAAAVAVVGGFVWSGVYNIGADDAHTRPVYTLLQLVRDRSITARARALHPPPNLDDPVLIRQGAGNYDAMCTGCHLRPGMAATELSMGLYPSPPDLSRAEVGDPSHQFWVIKHGIKASGMPAWGKSMGDEYIWNMVAFMRVLPTLDARRYQAMVDSSGGHSHGGGESRPHGDGMRMDTPASHAHPPGTPSHEDMVAESHAAIDMGGGPTADASKAHARAVGAPANHHQATVPAKAASKPAAGSVEHRHADGTVESHPASQPVPADDGHDHQH